MAVPFVRKFFVYAITDRISLGVISDKNFITSNLPGRPVVKSSDQTDIHQCIYPVIILNSGFKNSRDDQGPHTFTAIGLNEIREKFIPSFYFQLVGCI